MSSSTKIINVLKDDSFAEILTLFKSTPSGEVIFVLPKRSKAFQKEEHFSDLREAANEVKKTVSFLSSNPEANEYAQKYDFDVLLARATTPKKAGKVSTAKVASRSASVDVVNEIESFYEHPADKYEDEEEEEEAPVAMPIRRMNEVVHADKEDQHSVKIKVSKEKAYPIQVRQEVESEDIDEETDEALAEVWGTQSALEEEPVVKNFFKKTPAIKKERAPFVLPTKRRLAYTFGGAGFVLAAFLVYFNTGSANVTINPATTDLSFQLAVVASDSTAAVNTSTLTIPGQTFTIKKTVSQTFNATGSKDVAQKARGSIVLSNTGSAPQSLIATTRFESSDGHIFRSLTAAVVPAAKGSTPGTAEVQVIADKIGADYNVPAGNFTVPAFKEQGNTAKYQSITGTSKVAMHGGTSGKATVVTQDDFNKAKDLLTVQLKQAVSDETKSQTEGLKVVNDADIVIDAPTSTASVDDAADTFTMTLGGTLKTAGFKESDLQKLLAAYVNSKYQLDIVFEKLKLDYSSTTFDDAAHALHMNLAVTGPGYAKVDENKIVADLLGKKQAQIESYLKSVPGITSANVLLSPLWVRSVPKNSDKVHVTVSR